MVMVSRDECSAFMRLSLASVPLARVRSRQHVPQKVALDERQERQAQMAKIAIKTWPID
jgi:hypothetical protein